MTALEQLLEANEVEAALLLKGDFTPGEIEVARQAFQKGLELGKSVNAEELRALRTLRSDVSLLINWFTNDAAAALTWTDGQERYVLVLKSYETAAKWLDA